jgi:hypothetical protein
MALGLSRVNKPPEHSIDHLTRSKTKRPVMAVTSRTSLLSKITETASKRDTDAFFWSYTEEPHKTRRQAIIKAHPEV